jgi:hypothetical protein
MFENDAEKILSTIWESHGQSAGQLKDAQGQVT